MGYRFGASDFDVYKDNCKKILASFFYIKDEENDVETIEELVNNVFDSKYFVYYTSLFGSEDANGIEKSMCFAIIIDPSNNTFYNALCEMDVETGKVTMNDVLYYRYWDIENIFSVSVTAVYTILCDCDIDFKMNEVMESIVDNIDFAHELFCASLYDLSELDAEKEQKKSNSSLKLIVDNTK